jgi:hypothetical protein
MTWVDDVGGAFCLNEDGMTTWVDDVGGAFRMLRNCNAACARLTAPRLVSEDARLDAAAAPVPLPVPAPAPLPVPVPLMTVPLMTVPVPTPLVPLPQPVPAAACVCARALETRGPAVSALLAAVGMCVPVFLPCLRSYPQGS